LCSIPFLIPRSTIRPLKPRPTDSVRGLRMPRLAVLASVAGIGLIALTIAMGRDRAWERLSETRVEDEVRWTIIPTVIDMIGKYFPVGAGTGSFERIFRADEPDRLLGPGYMQHAHNDWLDALLTGGAIAAVLLGVAVAAWFLRFGQLIVRRPQNDGARRLSILGLTLVGLMGLSSFVDYPLRVPSLACLFVLAAIWAGCWRSPHGDSDASRGAEAANHPAGLRGTV
jgi:O-antigen ligase